MKPTLRDLLLRAKTPFDEYRISQRTQIVEINGSYDTSLLRDTIKTTDTASVSSVDSEFKLELSATGDKATIATASRGRYIPGYAAEAGLGTRLPEYPDGDGVARWGYFDLEPETQDINDGAFFGADADGLFVSIWRNGTEQVKVDQGDWNINPNFEIDPSRGYIYQILFVYYGYGPIWFRVIDPEEECVVDIHKYVDEGATTLGNSNLQVAGQADTGTTGDPFDLYVSGRQFAVYGTPIVKIRKVAHLVEDVNIPTDGYVPVMSFRRKDNKRAVPIQIQAFECLTDNDIVVQWRLDSNPSLDEGTIEWITPSNHDEDEVSIEVNEDADNIDMSTGLKVDEDIVLGGGGPQARGFAEDELVSDVPDEYIVTLCAKSIDGSAATATFIGKMVEER